MKLLEISQEVYLALLPIFTFVEEDDVQITHGLSDGRYTILLCACRVGETTRYGIIKHG